MKVMIRRMTAVMAAAFFVAACGEADDGAQVEVSGDVDGSEQVDAGDGDDAEVDAENASAIVRELETEPLLNADGSLREEIDRTNIAAIDYIYPRVESFAELVEESQSIVLAQATGRQQSDDSPLVLTYQDFDVHETIKGDDLTAITLSHNSGLEAYEDQVFLLQGQEDPHYLEGRKYLLFLSRTSEDQETWGTYGPGIGRYIVEDGHITGTFLDEMVAQVGADPPKFENARDNPDKYDPLDLVGMSVDEVADQIASEGS